MDAAIGAALAASMSAHYPKKHSTRKVPSERLARAEKGQIYNIGDAFKFGSAFNNYKVMSQVLKKQVIELISLLMHANS